MSVALWLVTAALAASPTAPKTEVAAKIAEYKSNTEGSLVVAGNWDTYKDVKKALANSDVRLERAGEEVGLARTMLEKIMEKDELKCGILVSEHNEASYAFLLLGECLPKKAEPTPPPAAEPAPAATPAENPAPTAAPAE